MPFFLLSLLSSLLKMSTNWCSPEGQFQKKGEPGKTVGLTTQVHEWKGYGFKFQAEICSGFSLKKAPSFTSPLASPFGMLKTGGHADPPNSGPEEDMALNGNDSRGFRKAMLKTDSGPRSKSSVPYHSSIPKTLGKHRCPAPLPRASVSSSVVCTGRNLTGLLWKSTSMESI